MSEIVIIGGTKGTGRELARHYVNAGQTVVITGRDAANAQDVAAELNSGIAAQAGKARGIAVDLSRPHSLRDSLQSIRAVRHLALVGMTRDSNSVADYNIDNAIALATTKIVGYTAAVAELKDRFAPGASVLLFGGISRDKPYPGSTTLSTVNTALPGLARTLSLELRPLRVNTIHPGLIADSPLWKDNQAVLDQGRQRVLTGALPTMADIVGGCVFLLENPAANGIHLNLDGGQTP